MALSLACNKTQRNATKKERCIPPFSSSLEIWPSPSLTSSLPSARSSAVSSSMLRSIVSAPDWQRMVAMEASRLPTARCRGVQPLNMAVSTLAPLLSSSFTDAMSRSSTAKWRAVFPLVPSCDGRRRKTMW